MMNDTMDAKTHALHSFGRMLTALEHAVAGITRAYRTDTGQPSLAPSEAHDRAMERLAKTAKGARVFLLDADVMAKAIYLAELTAMSQVVTEPEDQKWMMGLVNAMNDGANDYNFADMPPRIGIALRQWAANQMSAPWPDLRLPFPVSYFAYGMGYELNDLERELRNMAWVPAPIMVLVRGHLFTDEGDVVEMRELVNMTPDPWDHEGMTLHPWANMPTLASIRLQEVGKWEIPMITATWATALTSWVMDPRNQFSTNRPTLATRFAWNKAAKRIKAKKRPAPPDLYVVKVSPDVYGSYAGRGRDADRKVEWSHRWDVRAHRRVYVKRGPSPIVPEQRAKLVALGYKVYDRALTSEAMALMTQKHVPHQQPNEWIALKTSWVKAHVKGPDNKPYVRSVHDMTAGKGENKAC